MLKFVKIKIGLEFNKTKNFIANMINDEEYNKVFKNIKKNKNHENRSNGFIVISSDDADLKGLAQGECLVLRCGKCGSNIGIGVTADVVTDVMNGVTKEVEVDKDEWDCPGCYTVLEFPSDRLMSIVSPYDKYFILKDLQNVQDEVDDEIQMAYINQIGKPKYVTYLATKSPSTIDSRDDFSLTRDPWNDNCR